MADQDRVRQWLVRLGRFTVSSISSDEAAAFVADMAPMLAERFSDASFTPRSLEHVAAECKYLPTYGEIVAHLRTFVEQREHETASVTDQRDGLTDENRSCVRNWQRHASGDWGKIIPVNPQAALYRELDRWRRTRNPVFDHLVASDERAYSIAQRNGWIVPRRAAATTLKPEVRRGPPLDDLDA
jgi:hypothetical protein